MYFTGLKSTTSCIKNIFFKLLPVLVLTILFFGRSGEVKACNNSSFVINSIVDNGNGTWTYNITFTVELGSLDVSYYGSVFKFTSSSGTPTVLPGYTSPLPSGGALSSNLTGFIGANVNSQAADSDWNVYDNVTNVLSYECPDLFWLCYG